MRKSFKSSNRIRIVPKNCSFCENKTIPNYKDTAILSKFVTERGKIIGRNRTGICSKHQRAITREIKKARYIGLMTFVVRA